MKLKTLCSMAICAALLLCSAAPTLATSTVPRPDFSKNYYVKLPYDMREMPVRAILETLGAEVAWDAARSVAILRYEDNAFRLDYQKGTMFDEATSQELRMPSAGAGAYHSQLVNGRLVMDPVTMRELIDRLGIGVTILETYVVVEGAFLFQDPQDTIPVTIGIHTDHGDYTYTITTQIRALANYYFYTVTLFEEARTLQPRELTLLVNGKNITENNYVMSGGYIYFQNSLTAYLPVRAVLEELGVEVTWDAASGLTLLKFEGKTYILDAKKVSLVDAETSMELLVLSKADIALYHSRLVDNRIVMDSLTLQEVINQLGINATISQNAEAISIDTTLTANSETQE